MTDSPLELAHARLLASHIPATLSGPIRDLIDSVYEGAEDDLALRAEVQAVANRYGTPRMRDRVKQFLAGLDLDAIRAEGKADRASIASKRPVKAISIMLTADANEVPAVTVTVSADGRLVIIAGGNIVADTATNPCTDCVRTMIGRTLYGCASAMSKAANSRAGEPVSDSIIPVIRENLVGWLRRPIAGAAQESLGNAWAGCIVAYCVIDKGVLWIPVSKGGAV